MIPVESPRVVVKPLQSFCSLGRVRAEIPPTVIERVHMIERILMQPLLCRHDANNVVELLKNIEDDPDSHDKAYGLITEKCGANADQDSKRAQHIISFYHLQNNKALELSSIFKSYLEDPPMTNDNLMEIAKQLPYCVSEALFDEDISKLIGRDHSQEIKAILDPKRLKLTEVSKAQSRNLEQEQLEGYPLLYAHLLKMRTLNSRNERFAEINRMSYSELCGIVLQARNALCSKVDNLPADKQIFFLLGCTGAGKSTALCFLRGDIMILKGDRYISLNDHKQLIGEDGATSCTFLPNISEFEDRIFVDFPGFEDTHGPLISLGMELALKALFLKYQAFHPKVLVIESINNNEGRYAAAQALREKLKRLFDNPANCILGITKYSQESNYIHLRAHKEEEAKRNLMPSDEERELLVEINFLKTTSPTKFQDVINEKEAKLDEIISQRLKGNRKVTETAETLQLCERLRRKEEELKSQIGVRSFIRFDELNSAEHVDKCLLQLEDMTNTNVVLSNNMRLDPDTRALLVGRFKDDVVRLVRHREDYSPELRDFNQFQQLVFDSSLIKALFSKSHPDIEMLLHLPEMDSTLVREYDLAVVHDCIEQYIKAIVSALDITRVDTVLNEVVIDKSYQQALQKALNQLKSCIENLTGQEWETLRKDPNPKVIVLADQYRLPKWLQSICGTMPLGIPRAVLTLFQSLAQVQENQDKLKDAFNDCTNDLNAMHEILLNLKKIEAMIKRREELDSVLHVVPISIDKLDNLHLDLNARVNKICETFGKKMWDQNVEYILEKLHLDRFDAKNTMHIDCLLAYACQIMDPSILGIYEVELAYESNQTQPEKPFESAARKRIEAIKNHLRLIDYDLNQRLLQQDPVEWLSYMQETTKNIRVAQLLIEKDSTEIAILNDTVLNNRANKIDALTNICHQMADQLAKQQAPLNRQNLAKLSDEITSLSKLAHTEFLIRSRVIAACGVSTVSWTDAKKKAAIDCKSEQIARFRLTIKRNDPIHRSLQFEAEGVLPELHYENLRLQRPLDKALLAAALLQKYNNLKRK